ncbi:uncharacterized protein EURHEDRAFT_409820 [Aspergillus ruber CBS 135680]|uniref:Uncharacterized protein n=1 Tax=Aspergillus ruber (strain CBS 135680) TaxID=1388766 RepID=A0A017SMX3_ASPRC|nr:uncharacterized protein EURHEDRAFT_409820 [Aspergillus ruber CBS 135680]EYE97595.1 hypothetical protein EURHEDRAFT_409820 [Aspergillus ruber CBS 135680]
MSAKPGRFLAQGFYPITYKVIARRKQVGEVRSKDLNMLISQRWALRKLYECPNRERKVRTKYCPTTCSAWAKPLHWGASVYYLGPDCRPSRVHCSRNTMG